MWIINEISKSFHNQYAITNKFAHYSGDVVDIELFNSEALQQIALINFKDTARNHVRQVIMTQRYSFIESEMLSYIPYCVATRPKKALVYGTLNAMIAHNLASYDIEVDMVVGDMEALYTLSGFIPNFKEINDNPNITFYENFIDIKHCGYDIVIHDHSPNFNGFCALKKMVNEKFICIFGIKNLYLEPSSALDTLATGMNFGHIMMPFIVPSLEQKFYVFLSNHAHPLADLQLQKSDMMDRTEYYNANLHESVFRLPTFLQRIILPYVKN